MEKGIDSDEYGGHKRTSFPCLATARYVVASVVSVLTVAVVVLVIIVALRPEKVIFFIPHQCVVADRVWWDDPDLIMAPSEYAPSIPGRIGGRATSTKTAGAVIINDAGADADTSFPIGTFPPVKNVSFLVSFTAENPNGRADVSGKNVTIRVLDMPGYGSLNFSFQNLTEIITYELQNQQFSVNRQTSHTLREWILVNDTAGVLSYLAKTYGGSNSFTAMVQVNATIVTSVSVASPEPQIYYCWPVTVATYCGNGRLSTSCWLEKEMDYSVSYVPAPVPVPAPAPAPAAAP